MGSKVWGLIVAGFAGAVVLAGTARADMVYLKNGTSFWAAETEETEDEVIITRGGQTQRIPKASVDRIEKTSTNLPNYPVAPPPGPPAVSVGPGGPPAVPGGPPAGGAPAGQIPLPGAGAPAPGMPGGPPGSEVTGQPGPYPPPGLPPQR